MQQKPSNGSASEARPRTAKVVVIAQEIIDRALRLTRDDEPADRTRALLNLFQTD
jgi:hypothetical protein